MHDATITVITALHALAHRIALTEGESVAMDAYGESLTPGLWEQTLSLFAEADGQGSDDDYTLFVLEWLAMDEDAFVARFGDRGGARRSRPMQPSSIGSLAQSIVLRSPCERPFGVRSP